MPPSSIDISTCALRPSLNLKFPRMRISGLVSPVRMASGRGGRPSASPLGNNPSRKQPQPSVPPRSPRPPAPTSMGPKVCNCKNSRCLKLYCECFSSGKYCEGCNCVNCCNNPEHEDARQGAIEAIIER